jgi:hypothetical protein
MLNISVSNDFTCSKWYDNISETSGNCCDCSFFNKKAVYCKKLKASILNILPHRFVCKDFERTFVFAKPITIIEKIKNVLKK